MHYYTEQRMAAKNAQHVIFASFFHVIVPELELLNILSQLRGLARPPVIIVAPRGQDDGQGQGLIMKGHMFLHTTLDVSFVAMAVNPTYRFKTTDWP